MTKWDRAKNDNAISNPFTLTFAKVPNVLIERNAQKNQIENMFNSMTPSNMIYMITGARGTGKTVMLSELINSFYEDNDWVTIDLDPLQDLVNQFDYKLKSRNMRSKNTEVTISTPEILGASAELKIKSSKDTDLESSIEKSLEKIKKQGRRVFIAIDDASNTEQMRLFASMYQRLIRHDFPVYLVMTGIAKELQSLQDEKSLTFLTRALKITIETLNSTRIRAKYQEVLKIDYELADDMAKFVKGYTYGFQVLGYIAWEWQNKKRKFTLDNLVDEFDLQIAECSYDKIWVELSDRDKDVLYCIAEEGIANVESVRNKLNMTSPSFSTYRMRLIKQGVVNPIRHGYLEISLPRFDEYVRRHYELF